MVYVHTCILCRAAAAAAAAANPAWTRDEVMRCMGRPLTQRALLFVLVMVNGGRVKGGGSGWTMQMHNWRGKKEEGVERVHDISICNYT